MPTLPTMVTFDLSRASLEARFTGSLVCPEAHTMTESTPLPLVKCEMWTIRSGSLMPMARLAPVFRARSSLSFLVSRATTLHPALRQIWTTRFPTSPTPMTATDSPSPAALLLNPCVAMEPRVVKAASFIPTPSGTLATRFRGTATYSAWQANPSPAQATRSPAAMSVTFEPILTTVPETLYPSGTSGFLTWLT